MRMQSVWSFYFGRRQLKHCSKLLHNSFRFYSNAFGYQTIALGDYSGAATAWVSTNNFSGSFILAIKTFVFQDE